MHKLNLQHLKLTRVHHLDQTLASFIASGCHSPIRLANLIEAYCLTSRVHIAHQLFDHFLHPNLLLFNTLLRCISPIASINLIASVNSRFILPFDEFTYTYGLGACARSRTPSSLWFGRQLHRKTLQVGLASHLRVASTLIHFYGCHGCPETAREVFDEIRERNIVAWNSMLSCYCSNKLYPQAISLFQKLYRVEKPNGTTALCVLSAMARLGDTKPGQCFHAYIQKAIQTPEKDVYIGTGLVDMYAKSGDLSSALKVFDAMPQRNVITWSAMATGFAVHGSGEQALKFLDDMMKAGIRPNAVTMTSILSACCNAGLVREGLHLIRNMKVKFGLEPVIQHYGCVVSMLGRAGQLKEAYRTIVEMGERADAVIWRVLLSACRSQGDTEIGERVGRVLLEMMGGLCKSEDYIALSNLYASCEKWQQVEKVRRDMKAKNVGVKAGASFA